MAAKLIDNMEDQETQLFVDGEFQAGWAIFEMTETQRARVENMLSHAVEVGKRKRSLEIRKLLGA